MKYIEYLKQLNDCPFCSNVNHRILSENSNAILIYADAPYHKYHLLVVPKKHTENIKDLTWEENVSITALIVNAVKTLDKIGHNDCSILVRDGQAPAKTIKHLHYHIIPGGVIEDVSLNCEVRKMLSSKEEEELRKELLILENS